jgi:acetylornithine deacetylase
VTVAGDAIASLTRLISFATESRTSNSDLVEWVGDRASAAGADVQVVPGASGRANLLASFGPARSGGLLLSAHSDVVPAGDGWATPAYTVTRQGDLLFGRGTADMKGFIAVALELLCRTDASALRRPVHLALSYDEEVGCAGVGGLLQHLVTTPTVRPDLVLVGEPTMMHPCHRHLGKVAFDLTFSAAAGHSSRSHSLPSAISSAARVVSCIDAENRRHQPADGAEPDVSMNCGTLHGGRGLNIIADRCEMSFEVRFSTERDPELLLADVRDAVNRERALLAAVGGDVLMVRTIDYPALHTDENQALVHIVERIADAGAVTAIGYGTEGGLFAAALGVPVVICGPGDIGVAHGPDEFVSIEQLLRCDRFLSGLVDALCVDVAATPP